MKWIALGLLAIALALIAALAFLSVSTRQNPVAGRVNGALTPCPSTPNCVCSEAGNDEEHYIEPFKEAGLDMDRIGAVIRSLGGIVDTQSADYLSARFISSVFRFVDDVEVRAANDGVFHVRSASRAGKSDLGVNRSRVEAIRTALRG